MNKAKLILTITVITLILTGCSGCDECAGLPTYRKEVGVGYVFAYDSGGVLHPVAGAFVTVENRYWQQGLFGKDWNLATESYITDAEGRYQVRFIEKGCYTRPNGNKEMLYCNHYNFYCNNKYFFSTTDEIIKNHSQNNTLKLDTIKL